MKTLIFIDDERNFEDVTWVSYPHFDKVVTLRQYHEFENYIDDIVIQGGTLEGLYFSFDHDLGLEDSERNRELTGHDCAWYLVELMGEMKTNPNTINYWVHSQNPVGKKNIESLLENYLDFYNGIRK